MTKRFFLGLHVSISGGLHQAPVRAAGLSCNAMQIFSHSPRSWTYKIPTDEEIELFKLKTLECGIERFFVHSSYLINLCSENKEVREKSEKLLLYEAHLTSRLGADALILHPGRSGRGDPQRAVKMIARSLNRVGEAVGEPIISLETTAGQSGELGSTIEGLGEIIEKTSGTVIKGICIDTCHIFASGYDIRKRSEVNKLFRKINQITGALPVLCIHLNDSKTPLGSGRDRHEQIGMGEIGIEGFKNFLNVGPVKGIPLILETPKVNDDDDRKNLEVVKGLVQAKGV